MSKREKIFKMFKLYLHTDFFLYRLALGYYRLSKTNIILKMRHINYFLGFLPQILAVFGYVKQLLL